MIAEHLAGRSLLLDANLSVLLCAGLAGRQFIVSHKRLAAYDLADFDLLMELIDAAEAICISPNVATETSNIALQVIRLHREAIGEALTSMIRRATEFYIASSEVAGGADFLRLGLSDAVLLQMLRADQRRVLLTADYDLFGLASKAGLRALNFNHVRDMRNG